MSTKKTPWFPPDIRPARRGLYEIKYHHFTDDIWTGWSWWDGKSWGSRNCTKLDSIESKHRPALGPVDSWRGLARKAQP